jgi:hypothetical protein
VLDPAEKTIIHIPSVNSRESTKDKIAKWSTSSRRSAIGRAWMPQPASRRSFADGRVLRIADLVDDDPAKRDRVSAALKDPAQKNNRDMWISSSRSAWRRKASTGSGANTR